MAGGNFFPPFPLNFQAASSAGCLGQLSRAASAPLNELLMSLQLLIGRAHAPRAGRAAERDAEQGKHPLAGSGLAVPAPVPGGMLGSGYGMPSCSVVLGMEPGRFGERSGIFQREMSGCL